LNSSWGVSSKTRLTLIQLKKSAAVTVFMRPQRRLSWLGREKERLELVKQGATTDEKRGAHIHQIYGH